MDSLLNPADISGPLQVVKITDFDDSKGESRAAVELSGPVAREFADQWRDNPVRIINAKVNHAVLGIDIEPNFDEAEFQFSKGAARGRIELPATVRREKEGIATGPLSASLIPLDTLLAKIVLADQDRELTGEQRKQLIMEIHRDYPAVIQTLGLDDAVFSLGQLEWIARLRKQGIDIEDLRRFLFGLRSVDLLDSITERLRMPPPLKKEVRKGDSVIYVIQGFTHARAMGVFGETDDCRLVGSSVVFPRGNRTTYESRFPMRLAAKKDLHLQDTKLPMRFFGTRERNVRGYNGVIGREDFENKVESFAKVDTEILPSYEAAQFVFEVLKRTQGGKKAVLIKNQADFERIMRGDQSLVRSYNPMKIRNPVNPLSLAEQPSLKHYTEHTDPLSFAELQLMEGGSSAGDQKEQQGETGILFCKYFPDKDVLRRLYPHAHKLRAIVFQAPSYKPTDSVPKGEAKYPMEAHIFFGAEEFVALREFHRRFPDVKIIWSHPGPKRNLVFVDDEKGKLPMFAKPEIAAYLLDPESSLRVSFCGSSSAKPGADKEVQDREEKAFTAMYCDYARQKGLKPVGINGGGPDVMERNGRHLQELGAVSVSSACDLGKAGQTRHMNWDAVFNSAGDTTSFALREDVLLSGEIVHIAPGGIGSIQELLAILAQNKTGMAAKRIFLVGREYWKGIIQQLIEAGTVKNIDADYIKLLFVVDTPDEAREILEKIDTDPAYIEQHRAMWQAEIDKRKKAKQSEEKP